MVELPQNLTKLYYSIGEVSEMLGLSNSLIRYWEGEFPELKPRKSRKGDRQFTVKDIETLVLIHSLVKDRGFTIEGARKEMKVIASRKKVIAPIIKKLKSIRKGLVEMKSHFDSAQ